MQQVEVTDLPVRLSALLTALDYGEEVVLTEAQQPVARLVRLENGNRAGRGVEMAEILERLAERHPFTEIKDAVAWQREIRQDRPLPGRE